jgi:hypothetical protein
MLSQQLLGIQPKDNTIVANEVSPNRFPMPIVQNILPPHIIPSLFDTE